MSPVTIIQNPAPPKPRGFVHPVVRPLPPRGTGNELATW
jgi:hypothetical protein